MRPGQLAGEGGEEVVQGPRNDYVVVDTYHPYDDNDGETNTWKTNTRMSVFAGRQGCLLCWDNGKQPS